MSADATWRVVDGAFIKGTNRVKAGCHHRPGLSACGGCYARLQEALATIADALADSPMRARDAGQVVTDVVAAMRAEGGVA